MKICFEYKNYDYSVNLESKEHYFDIETSNGFMSMKAQVKIQENGDIIIIKPIGFVIKDSKIQINDNLIKEFFKATRIASIMHKFSNFSVFEALQYIEPFGDEVAINCSVLNTKFWLEIH